jgi:uncharacterized protein (AIM24 family)
VDPIAEVAELQARPRACPTPRRRSRSRGASGRADDIEFRIVGHEMQFVEIELDPGESAIAEAGALMFKDATVQMDTVFGAANGDQGGFMGKVMAAGKRADRRACSPRLHPERPWQGQGRLRRALPRHRAGDEAGPAWRPPDLPEGQLPGRRARRADRRAVPAQDHDRPVRRRGFIMQKLEGDGWVFIHAGGCVVERELAAGERLDVDTGCVVAYHPTVDMDVRRVAGIKSMLFGGEGVFLATLTGPARSGCNRCRSRAWPAAWMAAPQGGGQSRGEGSVLGGLGRIWTVTTGSEPLASVGADPGRHLPPRFPEWEGSHPARPATASVCWRPFLNPAPRAHCR